MARNFSGHGTCRANICLGARSQANVQINNASRIVYLESEQEESSMFFSLIRRSRLFFFHATALLLFCFALSPLASAGPLPEQGAFLTGSAVEDALSTRGFLALGGRGEDAALTPRGGAEESLPEQFLGGSYLGMLLFGYPATGFGGADLAALAVLAYLVLRAVGGRKTGNGDRRFTLHTRDDNAWPDDEETPPQTRPRPPQGTGSGDPRDNAWSRRLKGDSSSQNGPGTENEERPHPFGDAPFGRRDIPQRKPGVTVKDRADAMWSHLSSQQPEQPEAAPADQAAIAEGAHIPAGFDVKDFLDGARTLYVRLQKAWAARKVDDIALFITDGMLNLLKQQAEANPEPSDVDIVLVNATLLNVGEEPGPAGNQWADVHFTVLMRAGGEEHPAEINEQWRFVRGKDSGGMWRLSGIEAAE